MKGYWGLLDSTRVYFGPFGSQPLSPGSFDFGVWPLEVPKVGTDVNTVGGHKTTLVIKLAFINV